MRQAIELRIRDGSVRRRLERLLARCRRRPVLALWPLPLGRLRRRGRGRTARRAGRGWRAVRVEQVARRAGRSERNRSDVDRPAVRGREIRDALARRRGRGRSHSVRSRAARNADFRATAKFATASSWSRERALDRCTLTWNARSRVNDSTRSTPSSHFRSAARPLTRRVREALGWPTV